MRFYVICAGFAITSLCMASCRGQGRTNGGDHPTTSAPATQMALSQEGSGKVVLVPHMDVPIARGKTIIWSGAIQLAWDQLSGTVDGDMAVPPLPDAVILLQQRGTITGLGDDAFAMLDRTTPEGILRVRSAFSGRFKGADCELLKVLPADTSSKTMFAYAIIDKHLKFKTPFLRLNTLSFGRSDATTPFESFGTALIKTGSNHADLVKQATQVAVLWHKFLKGDDETTGSEEFIIELKTDHDNDQLVLAMIDPESTLLKTVAKVNSLCERARMRGGSISADELETSPEKLSACAELQLFDNLEVPVVECQMSRVFHELDSVCVVNSRTKVSVGPMAAFVETVRFSLNQDGATLYSEAGGWGLFGSQMGRNFIFDRPFLIMLKGRNTTNPYLAIWVGNTSVLKRTVIATTPISTSCSGPANVGQ